MRRAPQPVHRNDSQPFARPLVETDVAARRVPPGTGPPEMSILRRIIVLFRPRRARYGDDVLFAGWVQLPPMFRQRIVRRH